MNEIIDITEVCYNKLKNKSLMFLRLYENYYIDDNGNEHDNSQWQSINRDWGISFKAGNFANRSFGYCLTLVGELEEKKDEKGKSFRASITNITGSDPSEWDEIFNCLIAKLQYKEGKEYAYLELLWALDKLSWDSTTLIFTIRSYPVEIRSFIIDNLNKVGKCLSLKKQNILKSVCESLGGRYDVYIPKTISELYKEKPYNQSLNLFQIIDKILDRPYNSDAIKDFDESNQLIAIYKWLNTNDSLSDYTILTKPIFALVSEETRLNIVKRYFHDIRNKFTSLNLDILTQFKENHYDSFIKYRYCLESPSEPIVLTTPLLCDSLITLYNTKGKSFQSFDGVLDFAMMHCDPTNPGVDFKLNRILPTCENGAVFNEKFKGFIDYSIITAIDERLLTEENLQEVLRHILDQCGMRKTYYSCRFSDDTAIDENTLQKCLKLIGKSSKDCLTTLPYKDKWEVDEKKISIIKDFLNTSIEKDNNSIYNVDLDMLSIELFKEYIQSLPNKFKKISDKEFLVLSYNEVEQTLDLFLVECFGKKLRMRFFPQRDALVGLSFDVFGFKEQVFDELTEKDKYNPNCEKYKAAIQKCQEEESNEVSRRTAISLQDELNVPISTEGYFEVKYDKSLFDKIIRKYYFKEKIKEKDHLWDKEFLKKQNIQGFKPFCAPKLANDKNSAIDLPFFWCRGKECFRNSLDKQSLSDSTHWTSYSFFHLTEIMGFPMLKKTEGGLEPDEVIRQFIAISNKVMQKFRRLRCRECGHLLFASKSIGFNRYNYYGCANPVCSEYKQLVYLNYCYNCKSGLIDSRDSRQCPNGWYICPSCLSCCNDDQYNRQAQRFVLNGQPVPTRIQSMLGLGHNNRGIYFCPNCGTKLEKVGKEQGAIVWECPICGKMN